MTRRLQALHDAGGDVAAAEAAMNAALAGLYELTEAERALISERLGCVGRSYRSPLRWLHVQEHPRP